SPHIRQSRAPRHGAGDARSHLARGTTRPEIPIGCSGSCSLGQTSSPSVVGRRVSSDSTTSSGSSACGSRKGCAEPKPTSYRGRRTSSRPGPALSDNCSMHVVVGSMFIALGATCIGYLWAGGPPFEREPPLFVLGVSLIFLSAGLAGRLRAPALLARAGVGAGLVGIAWTATRYLAGIEIESADTLMQSLYLAGI